VTRIQRALKSACVVFRRQCTSGMCDDKRCRFKHVGSDNVTNRSRSLTTFLFEAASPSRSRGSRASYRRPTLLRSPSRGDSVDEKRRRQVLAAFNGEFDSPAASYTVKIRIDWADKVSCVVSFRPESIISFVMCKQHYIPVLLCCWADTVNYSVAQKAGTLCFAAVTSIIFYMWPNLWRHHLVCLKLRHM